MGSAHQPKSTRASRERSVRSSPRSPTKPISGRAITHPQRRARQKPARLRRPRALGALREIRERLEAALSVTGLCVITLKAQAADHDVDIALCLECCVEQAISNGMEHIDNVLEGGAS